MKVNGKDDIPYIMENKKCLKPPTSTANRTFPLAAPSAPSPETPSDCPEGSRAHSEGAVQGLSARS